MERYTSVIAVFLKTDYLQWMAPLPLCFVTSSKKKLAEFLHAVGDNTIAHVSMDLPELQGDPETVAREKARAASRIYGGPVLVEDVSLCFNAYKGLPGVYVKSFLTAVGPSGLCNMLLPYEDKSAYALCIYAFCDVTVDDKPALFTGRADGRIVPPRGPQTFGWDCIFEPLEGGGKTYAEMEMVEKSAISHRGKALEKVKAFLTNLGVKVPCVK